MSFLDLVIDYNQLLNAGYNKRFLNQSLHSLLSLPFFLFLMTALAAILTLNTLKKSDNFKFIVLGIIISVLIYYFKDLSLALGQTDRVSFSFGHMVSSNCFKFFYFHRSFTN